MVSVEAVKEIVLLRCIESPSILAVLNFIAALTAIRLLEISVGPLEKVRAALTAMLSLVKLMSFNDPGELLKMTVTLLKVVVLFGKLNAALTVTVPPPVNVQPSQVPVVAKFRV